MTFRFPIPGKAEIDQRIEEALMQYLGIEREEVPRRRYFDAENEYTLMIEHRAVSRASLFLTQWGGFSIDDLADEPNPENQLLAKIYILPDENQQGLSEWFKEHTQEGPIPAEDSLERFYTKRNVYARIVPVELAKTG